MLEAIKRFIKDMFNYMIEVERMKHESKIYMKGTFLYSDLNETENNFSPFRRTRLS